MLFKFIESDGNDEKSVATLDWCDKHGRDTGFRATISLTILGEACSKLPGFRGFLPGQLFDIDVHPVVIKPPDAEPALRPVTDAREMLAV